MIKLLPFTPPPVPPTTTTSDPSPPREDEDTDFTLVEGYGVSLGEIACLVCETRGRLDAMAFSAHHGYLMTYTGRTEVRVLDGFWQHGGDGELWLCVPSPYAGVHPLVICLDTDAYISLKRVAARFDCFTIGATHDFDHEICVRFDPHELDALLPIARITVVPRTQDGSAAPGGDTAMDLAAFWERIAEAHARADSDPVMQIRFLIRELCNRPLTEMLTFFQTLSCMLEEADRRIVWQAVGGSGDEVPAYFCLWLVLQGEETYQWVITQPQAFVRNLIKENITLADLRWGIAEEEATVTIVSQGVGGVTVS